MKIEDVHFNSINWNEVRATEHAGEVGTAYWKTVEQGNLRLRIVEYTPGYRSDHWCERGHVVFVLKGKIITELKDGRRIEVTAGNSYQVGDQQEPHRSEAPEGATLFIVD